MLKREIEAKLAHRIPAALSPVPQQAARLQPVGIANLDRLLGGGLPLGSVSELYGLDGSGHTSIALSLLAEASAEAACAYIDISDTLSPQSAAAAGVQLTNLLWVRFAGGPQNRPQENRVVPAPPASAVEHRPIGGGCGTSHPRGETKGLAPALEQMLFEKAERRKQKMEGTPGYPNQPLGLHTASQEQVDWERFNLRRVDEEDPLRRSDRQAAEAARVRAASPASATAMKAREQKPWDRLDRALRVTDQILQSGGFRIVVLDLCSTPAQEALRIPSATWFRFRRAAQESDAILLLLTREPCARSSAACVLECSVTEPPRVQGVLTAATRIAEVARQRTGIPMGRKAPGRATGWESAPSWMRASGEHA